jgi:hypothetical protein
MSSAGSVCKDWEFVSRGTEISLGKFVSEHFTPLTLNAKSEVISTEDTPDIWEAAKGEALEKARRKASRQASADSRTSDCGESYFKDMWKVAENQHSPILAGLNTLAEERGWEVALVPLIAGQRSVREKEWLEALRIFGIDKADGLRIIRRLGRNLLDEHEKLFGSYWRQTFGPSSSLLQLLGKGISVRTGGGRNGGSSG